MDRSFRILGRWADDEMRDGKNEREEIGENRCKAGKQVLILCLELAISPLRQAHIQFGRAGLFCPVPMWGITALEGVLVFNVTYLSGLGLEFLIY